MNRFGIKFELGFSCVSSDISPFLIPKGIRKGVYRASLHQKTSHYGFCLSWHRICEVNKYILFLCRKVVKKEPVLVSAVDFSTYP